MTPIYHCCVAIEITLPKKTRPVTVLTAEELDAIDDATFAELAADEDHLHQALEDPSTIRSGQALSIAKTKPRRQTVARQRTLDEVLEQDQDAEDQPGSGFGEGPSVCARYGHTRLGDIHSRHRQP